jgi:hypothetical protein
MMIESKPCPSCGGLTLGVEVETVKLNPASGRVPRQRVGILALPVQKQAA